MMTMSIAGRWVTVSVGILALAGAVVAGCSSKPGPYQARSVPPALENVETVVILSKALAKRVSVEGQRADRLPDNRLRVHANVRNLTKEPLHVQSQVVFKDKDSISLGDESAWYDMLLSENETRTFSADSMSDRAEFYTIRIREGR